MTEVIYKSFDSSESLFENIWKIFPNIELSKDIVPTLQMSSANFCNLRDKKIFMIKTFSEGGFGLVGEATVNGKKLKGRIFSFNPHGGKHDVFYINTIAKIGKHKNSIKIYKLSMSIISIVDPLSDMVFGSILGHLYDIGLCPFISKYFGVYYCEKNKETTMIIEESNYELRNLLRKDNRGLITASEFKNINVQLLYTFYILKKYLGCVHFDSHLRNIMLTTAEYTYQGKTNSKYMVIKSKLGTIICRRTKFLVKLIDYGAMLMNFNNSSIDKFKRNLTLLSDFNDLNKIGAYNTMEMSLNSKSFANTVDILFTLINEYEYLSKGLENTDQAVFDYRYKDINYEFLQVLDEITISMLGKPMSTFLTEFPKFTVTSPKEWFMRNHSTGIFYGYEDEDYLLQTIINLCTMKGKKLYVLEPDINVSDVSEDNSWVLDCKITEYSETINRFNKLIKYSKKCDNNLRSVYCDFVKLYNQKSFDFSDNTTIYNSDSLKIISRNSNWNLNPVYKNYNTWFSGERIPVSKLEKNIEEVRFFLIEIKKYKTAKLLANTFLNKTLGISFPLGFTGQGFISTDDPVFFSHDKKSYPDKAVLYLHNNFFGVEQYNTFIDRHCKLQLPFKIKQGLRYTWAVSIGPVLLWDGKISPILTNNEIESRLVLVIRGNQFGFLLIEGGGFPTAGLDHINTAKLCLNLGMDKAINVHSGLTTNVIFNDNFLCKSPFAGKNMNVLDIVM
nr:MAG: serine/threonine protein kinase [Diabrotica toursvirus 3a]